MQNHGIRQTPASGSEVSYFLRHRFLGCVEVKILNSISPLGPELFLIINLSKKSHLRKVP